MILEYNRTFSFICPECSLRNIKDMSVFDINSSKKLTFYCDDECDDYCISMQQIKDKYNIEIHCPVCGEPHTFSMKKNTFWANSFLNLQCPFSSVDICFIGKYETVKSLSQKQDFLISQSDYIDNDTTLEETLCLSMERLDFLLEQKNVHCPCGSSEIDAEIEECPDRLNIVFTCLDCGHSKTIPLNAEFLYYIHSHNSLDIE